MKNKPSKKKCLYAHIDSMNGLNGDCFCTYCGEQIHKGVKPNRDLEDIGIKMLINEVNSYKPSKKTEWGENMDYFEFKTPEDLIKGMAWFNAEVDRILHQKYNEIRDEIKKLKTITPKDAVKKAQMSYTKRGAKPHLDGNKTLLKAYWGTHGHNGAIDKVVSLLTYLSNRKV